MCCSTTKSAMSPFKPKAVRTATAMNCCAAWKVRRMSMSTNMRAGIEKRQAV